MAYDDLREFLGALDAAGQLLRISEQVAPEPDLGRRQPRRPDSATERQRCTSTTSPGSRTRESR
jgi:hypothetical protein